MSFISDFIFSPQPEPAINQTRYDVFYMLFFERFFLLISRSVVRNERSRPQKNGTKNVIKYTSRHHRVLSRYNIYPGDYYICAGLLAL